MKEAVGRKGSRAFEDFDFFYLPIDFETKRNKARECQKKPSTFRPSLSEQGYCFLNLHTQELARRFRQAGGHAKPAGKGLRYRMV